MQTPVSRVLHESISRTRGLQQAPCFAPKPTLAGEKWLGGGYVDGGLPFISRQGLVQRKVVDKVPSADQALQGHCISKSLTV